MFYNIYWAVDCVHLRVYLQTWLVCSLILVWFSDQYIDGEGVSGQCDNLLRMRTLSGFLFPPTYHVHPKHSAGCCHRGVNAAWKEGSPTVCRTVLETGNFVFQNARLFMFANVNICKSRCWSPADWGPPRGLEEALFTCSEECCPAQTLLYLSGTQGHSTGREGPLCPFPKFPPHSINKKTQCGRRKWNSCSCCNSIQNLWFTGPFYPFW